MPRFLTMVRIDEASMEDAEFPEDFGDRMGRLLEEITKAGVMLDTAGLRPSSEATRITRSGGRLSYTDGPFTETREVVGGYSICQCKDKAEALEWTRRFMEIHPVEWEFTCEVRQIAED
ncbi:YciI family protein [Streptomyces sp. C10-9-1]|uniref:YciI family protein n=1 Tax=Streptomyces sp. C10-9-1 TaxID=1859285 RepID=UPI00211363E4|nr:YciI family protein [Streptomyces sp. C10-9-1]MCQ6555240.1 YciI family protein [Streptomyces sp. C10-9-1]